MLRRASGLRTAALFGLLLSAAVAVGCDQAITGARENLAPPPPPPYPLAIVPSSLELVVGRRVQLHTYGGDGSDFQWASSDSAVATVSSGGAVTAIAAGEATITAGTASATVYVTGKFPGRPKF